MSKTRKIISLLLVVCLVFSFKISIAFAVSTPQDFFELKPFVVMGTLSNVKTEDLDILKQLGRLESFYDVNLLSKKTSLILVGENYTNLTTLLLELEGYTPINVTKDYPGNGIGVVEFLSNKNVKNIYGEMQPMSLLILSGSDEAGTENAINYVKQILSNRKQLKEGVTFVDANLNELNMPINKVPLGDEYTDYLSKFYAMLTHEKEDLEDKNVVLKNQTMEKETKIKENWNSDWQDFRGAFLRFDHNFLPSYPIGIFTTLADTTNPDLCKVSLSTYNGKILDENSTYVDFVKNNVRHTEIMFGVDDYPWNTKNYYAFRKENANEMFTFNELYGKVTGDCYAQAIFNEAVFRLWGFEPDKTFIITIGSNSGGHAVNLLNSDNSWFIFDSTNYGHPIYRSNYYDNYKYFREFFSESFYTVFSESGNLYSSKSNISFNDIKNIALEGKVLFKGDIKFGSKQNFKDTVEAFAPFTKFSNVVDVPFETTIFDAIPEIPQTIETTSYNYLTTDDFYKVREDLLESSSEYLSLLSYNEILDKSIKYPTSQYTVARFAMQTIRLKNSFVYTNSVFAPRTKDKAKEFSGTYSMTEILNFVKNVLADIKTVPSYSELVDYPDMVLFTKQGTPQSKALFAYAIMYNILQNNDKTNLYILWGPLDGYIAYKSNNQTTYLNCASGEITNKQPDGIWAEFNTQSVKFNNIAPFIEETTKSIDIIGNNKVTIKIPVRDLNWKNSDKSVECQSDKIKINPTKFSDYYKELEVDIDPTKFNEGNYSIPIKVSDEYGSDEITLNINIKKDTTPPTLTFKTSLLQFINTRSFSAEFLVNDDCSTPDNIKVFANIDNSGYKEIIGNKITVDDLSEGKHVILVKAQDEAGNESAEQTISFTVDTTHPTINLNIPQQTHSNTITISGSANDNLSGIDYLKINGQSIIISSDGSFTSTITLSEGLNQITMEAKDFAGNITKQTTTITYSPETVIQLTIGNSVFTVNGVPKQLDSPPVIKNSRTLLPIRAVIESLGGTVDWSPSDKKVTVSLGTNTIELWIGNPQAKVNGITKWIDDTNHKVVPEIINGRTMIPLRFVTENLGATVDWNQDTKTITITYRG